MGQESCQVAKLKELKEGQCFQALGRIVYIIKSIICVCACMHAHMHIHACTYETETERVLVKDKLSWRE